MFAIRIASLGLLLGFLATNAAHAETEQFSVLLFSKTAGWHHESILAGVTAIRNLGGHDFDALRSAYAQIDDTRPTTAATMSSVYARSATAMCSAAQGSDMKEKRCRLGKNAGRIAPTAATGNATAATPGTNTAAIASYNSEHEANIETRHVKYLNNIVEQDHRAVKRVVRPMLGSNPSSQLQQPLSASSLRT